MKLKHVTVPLALLVSPLLASPLLAFEDADAALDTNGDGVLSFEEVLAVTPELTVETFAALDLDQDGLVSADELLAASDAGLWPLAE